MIHWIRSSKAITPQQWRARENLKLRMNPYNTTILHSQHGNAIIALLSRTHPMTSPFTGNNLTISTALCLQIRSVNSAKEIVRLRHYITTIISIKVPHKTNDRQKISKYSSSGISNASQSKETPQQRNSRDR